MTLQKQKNTLIRSTKVIKNSCQAEKTFLNKKINLMHIQHHIYKTIRKLRNKTSDLRPSKRAIGSKFPNKLELVLISSYQKNQIDFESRQSEDSLFQKIDESKKLKYLKMFEQLIEKQPKQKHQLNRIAVQIANFTLVQFIKCLPSILQLANLGQEKYGNAFTVKLKCPLSIYNCDLNINRKIESYQSIFLEKMMFKRYIVYCIFKQYKFKEIKSSSIDESIYQYIHKLPKLDQICELHRNSQRFKKINPNLYESRLFANTMIKEILMNSKLSIQTRSQKKFQTTAVLLNSQKNSKQIFLYQHKILKEQKNKETFSFNLNNLNFNETLSQLKLSKLKNAFLFGKKIKLKQLQQSENAKTNKKKQQLLGGSDDNYQKFINSLDYQEQLKYDEQDSSNSQQTIKKNQLDKQQVQFHINQKIEQRKIENDCDESQQHQENELNRLIQILYGKHQQIIEYDQSVEIQKEPKKDEQKVELLQNSTNIQQIYIASKSSDYEDDYDSNQNLFPQFEQKGIQRFQSIIENLSSLQQNQKNKLINVQKNLKPECEQFLREMFQLGDHINSGGEADIFLHANDECIVYRVIQVKNDEDLDEQLLELQSIKVLNEQNILDLNVSHILEDRINNNIYLIHAMQKCEMSLQDEIIAKKPFSLDETLSFISTGFHLLIALRQKYIYHSDIKPGNILKDGDSNYKLSDFGASQKVLFCDPFTEWKMATMAFIPKKQTLFLPFYHDIYSFGKTIEMVLQQLENHQEIKQSLQQFINEDLCKDDENSIKINCFELPKLLLQQSDDIYSIILDLYPKLQKQDQNQEPKLIYKLMIKLIRYLKKQNCYDQSLFNLIKFIQEDKINHKSYYQQKLLLELGKYLYKILFFKGKFLDIKQYVKYEKEILLIPQIIFQCLNNNTIISHLQAYFDKNIFQLYSILIKLEQLKVYNFEDCQKSLEILKLKYKNIVTKIKEINQLPYQEYQLYNKLNYCKKYFDTDNQNQYQFYCENNYGKRQMQIIESINLISKNVFEYLKNEPNTKKNIQNSGQLNFITYFDCKNISLKFIGSEEQLKKAFKSFSPQLYFGESMAQVSQMCIALIFLCLDQVIQKLSNLNLSKYAPNQTYNQFTEVNSAQFNIDLFLNAVPAQNITLFTLDIRKNLIGLEGASILLQFIENIKQLEIVNINLARILIGDEQCEILNKTITNPNKFKTFNITFSRSDHTSQNLDQNALIPIKKIEYVNFGDNSHESQCFNNLEEINKQIYQQSLSLMQNNQAQKKYSIQENEQNLNPQVEQLDLLLDCTIALDDQADSNSQKKQQSNIRINLHQCGKYISFEGAQKLISRLLNCQNVSILNLNLSKSSINGQVAKIISQGLKHMQDITELNLNLNNNNIQDEGAQSIIDTFINCLNITQFSLKLMKNKIGADGIDCIADILNLCKNINQLNINLGGNSISDYGIQIIAKSLEKFENVSYLQLDLIDNKIDDQGFSDLTCILFKCKNISSLNLNLNCNNIVNPSLNDSNLLEQCLSIIDLTLELKENKIRMNVAINIANILKKCQNLTKLKISLKSCWNDHFGDNEIEVIANSLQDSQSLTELNLNLSFNKINAEGILYLTETLNRCQKINQLNLNLLHFSDDKMINFNGLNIFADTLKNSENISELNLSSGTYISTIYAQKVYKILEKCQNLTQLTLNFNYPQYLFLEEQDIQYAIILNFVDSLQKLQKLTRLELDLRLNRLGVEAIQNIANSLKKCQKITNLALDLYYTQIGKDGNNILVTTLENIQNIKSLELYLESTFDYQLVNFK
ncbi:hypothetical protein ABPG74_004840 [Tetrahymena malaccensis]